MDEFKPAVLTQRMGLEVLVLTQEPGNMLPHLAKGSLQTCLRSGSGDGKVVLHFLGGPNVVTES